MSVYARSDVASIALSASHGGCGRAHTRPAPGGVPVQVWELECPMCEKHLRTDSLWAPTASSIPETPDEKLSREANDKRTATEQAARNVEAMEKLGGMPDALAQVLMQLLGNQQAAVTQCPAGHSNAGSPRFCGECGTSMQPPVPEPTPGVLHSPEDAPDLDSLSLTDLKKLATRYGVPTRRSREDQIAALRDYLGQ